MEDAFLLLLSRTEWRRGLEPSRKQFYVCTMERVEKKFYIKQASGLGPAADCVTLGNLLNFSKPQFSQFQNRENNSVILRRALLKTKWGPVYKTLSTKYGMY